MRLLTGISIGTALGLLVAAASVGWAEEAGPPSVPEASKTGKVRPTREADSHEKEGRPAVGLKTAALKTVPIEGATIVKLALGAMSLGIVAFGLLYVYRKGLLGGGRLSGGGGIEILGRASLSPRHAVFVLRLDGKKILVGMAPDRLTSLAVLDEPAAMKQAGISKSPPLSRADANTFPSRSEAPSRTVTEDDLLPYRRQVNRLRDMLRRRGGETFCEKDIT